MNTLDASPSPAAYVRRLGSALKRRDRSAWLLVGSSAAGLLLGTIIVIFRDIVIPEQFGRDALKIWRIASGRDPEFIDRSFTPVATVYRAIGLGDNPTGAALLSYALAAATILTAIVASRRITAPLHTCVYIFMAFIASAIFLGQYSKDVFVFPIVALLLLVPRRIWWELLALGAMAGYAYWFRTYWALVLVGYILYRILTVRQVRLRYLLLLGAIAAPLIGLAFTVVMGVDPNHFRARVHDTQRSDVNTILLAIEPLVQPWGGAIDVAAAYGLILVPLTLPFTAGILYLAITLAFAYVRLTPLLAYRSARIWPEATGREGTLVRRALSLVLAYGMTQAVFEPDYGSVIRHFSPLLPLMVLLLLLLRHTRPATAGPRSGSWSWFVSRRPSGPGEAGGTSTAKSADGSDLVPESPVASAPSNAGADQGQGTRREPRRRARAHRGND